MIVLKTSMKYVVRGKKPSFQFGEGLNSIAFKRHKLQIQSNSFYYINAAQIFNLAL